MKKENNGAFRHCNVIARVYVPHEGRHLMGIKKERVLTESTLNSFKLKPESLIVTTLFFKASQYMFGNFIKKEKPNFKERKPDSQNNLSTIFPPKSDKINLVSRKCEFNIELSDLITFYESMEKEKDKRIYEQKRMFAHAEKDIIMGSLSLPVLDEKFSLDETNDLLNSGDQLSKNMNKINNTKKRRI